MTGIPDLRVGQSHYAQEGRQASSHDRERWPPPTVDQRPATGDREADGQVQDWLGHSTITMTMRYSHLSPGGEGS